MNMSVITKCPTCGGKIEINQSGIPKCRFCRNEIRGNYSGFAHLLEDIVEKRQMRDFAEAEEACLELLKKQPECAEAYWQLMLTELGVVYVLDEKASKVKPTFFGYSYTERDYIKKNKNYNKALQYATDNAQKEQYINRADELDGLLKKFFALVERESSYDVFISFKSSETAIVGNEEKTIKTDDYTKAYEIYNHLKGKYRVFFSPVSIGEDKKIVGEEYEPRIMKAIQSAQAMILVGSKREYIESEWVANEWKRYRYFVERGYKKKQSLVLAYTKQMPQLPAALKNIQLENVDMFLAGYLSELEAKLSFVHSGKGLKSLLGTRKIQTDFGDEQDKSFGYDIERVKITGSSDKAVVSISPTEARDMLTAKTLCANGQFDDAVKMYGNIIAKNPQNAEAYFGRYLANISVSPEGAQSIDKQIAKTDKRNVVDIENAIQTAHDAAYAWQVIDLLVGALGTDCSWKPKKLILDVISKYLDNVRIVKVLEYLLIHCEKCVDRGNISESESVCKYARGLFVAENKANNMSFILAYAKVLRYQRYFDQALKYYTELAEACHRSDIYWSILSCKLRVSDPSRVTIDFKVGNSGAKLSELGVNELFERCIILDENDEYRDRIFATAKWQIVHKNPSAKVFVETVVSCYRQLNKDALVRSFLYAVADTYLRDADYKSARAYFMELLVADPSDCEAHWGLLKCRLKVATDVGIVRKKKNLLNYEEFNNAINCASDEAYARYMDVNSGKAMHEGELDHLYTKPEIKEHILVTVIYSAPAIIALLMAVILGAFAVSSNALQITVALVSMALLVAYIGHAVYIFRNRKALRRTNVFLIFAKYRIILSVSISLLSFVLGIIIGYNI